MLPGTRSMRVLRQAAAPSPARRPAAEPAPNGLWEAIRQRNAALDAVFYDVGRIDETEARRLSPWLVAEGAILLVPPTGRGTVQPFESVEEFAAAGGAAVRALTVAGVGSSALGAAAFARNIADAVGESAVAVVSGYGLADALTEAMGGWFWFGALNSLRHLFESPADRAAAVQKPVAERTPGMPPFRRQVSSDTQTVIALLNDERLGFDVIVGHSKGNLVLSEALFAHVAAMKLQGRPARSEAMVITVSAAITMPAAFRAIVDVLGEWDWFGRLNSRPHIAIDVTVPGAWHHTNTELANHLPVTAVLREILARHGASAFRRRGSRNPVRAMAFPSR